MRARLTLIAAMFALGTAASAEPSKAPSQPAPQPTKIVLASAEPVRTPGAAAAKPTASPVKRAGRVTTCRCGGDVQRPAETPDQ
jgi:hypothetical protein